MRFEKFIIDGYRAIEHTEIEVGNNLVPIIGVNESGKTSILQAILAFDKKSDDTQRGSHLKYKNRYNRSEKQTAKITAEVVIESEKDLIYLSDQLKLTAGDELMKKLKEFQKKGVPLQLSRTFPGKKYRVENIEGISATANNNLAIQVYESLPFILYFDDFSDRVPDEIPFRLNPEDPGSYSAISISKSTEWHSLVEEVFLRNNSSLKEFLTMEDEKDKKALIADLQDALDKEIVVDWKELIKKYGDEFAEESDNLQLQLEVHEDTNKVSFEFQVKDRTTKNSRFFNITERSKGFQWFFNFTMKLKFNPKYLNTEDGAIYLLDEPGSYLHTSAQEELLLKLRDISKTNAILYCTHSQYLLDPEVINIAKIKIVRKSAGKIESISFRSSGISEEHGALTPLYRALHMKAPYTKKADYQIITEGITDYYLFNLLKNYGKNVINDKVSFIPGSGAKQLSVLISLAIAFSKNYRVLLDSDTEGREAHSDYQMQFGVHEIKKFFKYKLKAKKENVVLEELVSAADGKRLTKMTDTKSIKAAIPVLYYMGEKHKKEFISNLDETTLGRLAIVLGVINEVVNTKGASLPFD